MIGTADHIPVAIEKPLENQNVYTNLAIWSEGLLNVVEAPTSELGNIY